MLKLTNSFFRDFSRSQDNPSSLETFSPRPDEIFCERCGFYIYMMNRARHERLIHLVGAAAAVVEEAVD